jgi:predicted aldo/keto reductase-like oxidoreductase
MSQDNPLRLFVTHAWEQSDDYLRVFEYLESARNFFYKNFSTPEARPSSADKEVVRENLRKQMASVEAVVALSSLYATNPELLNFQMLYAQSKDIAVVLMKPFGGGPEVPKGILKLADEVVNWDERALVDALRRQARHEETTRWDTIEFKLD